MTTPPRIIPPSGPGSRATRVVLHFTRIASSWLNMVEIFLAQLTDEALRRRTSTSWPRSRPTWPRTTQTPNPSPGLPVTEQIFDKARCGPRHPQRNHQLGLGHSNRWMSHCGETVRTQVKGARESRPFQRCTPDY